MEVEKTKTLELKCCLLDADGAVREDTEVKVINWTASENPTAADRELLREKLDDAFDADDVQWPYNTAIRDSTGGLVPIKATNIDWEDLNGIVHDLTHDQNPKIFIQPTATATEQLPVTAAEAPVDAGGAAEIPVADEVTEIAEKTEGTHQMTGGELPTGHDPTRTKKCW